MKYDVVVAGGSVSGLLCAREAASRGHTVLVLERGHEIGTPQHCGGLLSRAALDYLGVEPSPRMMGNDIEAARITSPDGSGMTLPAMGTVEIDRRELDKRIADQAQRAGAAILAGTVFRGGRDGTARTSAGDVGYRVLVDARGAAAMGGGPDTLQSAQCEVCAEWIRRGQVAVMLDQERYPGFFAWVIPAGEGRGKVGVAGRGINALRAMESLLGELGGGSVLRRIVAPIWVGGAASRFVRGDTVAVGDAAGQAKPTTGGGIYSSGAGGLLAGRAIASYLESGDERSLDYGRAWRAKFGAEFQAQAAGRRILERLDNAAVNRIVSRVRPRAAPGAADGDFDFHASLLLGMLDARGALEAAGAVAASEARRVLERIRGART